MDRAGLVGRDDELALLRAQVTRLGQGRGGVAWIEGEPGIGKSRLLDAALSPADALGIRIFRAVGDELTPTLSLRVLADALGVDRDDALRAEIADLLIGRGDGLDAVLAATERMVGLVDRECARSPVALVVDDVQWADEASLAAFRQLARMVQQTPLLLLLAGRRLPQRAEVDRVREAVRHQSDGLFLDLQPLPDQAVAAIAAERLGARPGTRLSASFAAAGGNPLYVLEILEACLAGGLVEVGDEAGDRVAELPTTLDSVPESLAAAVGLRLTFLSGETESLLRVAAVLGPRFTMSELAPMTGLTLPELAPRLDEALRAGVLVEVGTEFTFRHPVVRQVLHERVAPPIRAGLHEHAARTLADAGVSWDRVAQHLLAAPEVIDGWVLAWLDGLPEAALLMLPGVGAALLEQARRVTVPGDPRRDRLTARLASVLRMQRRADDLIALGREALSGTTDPAAAGEIAWQLARGYQLRPGQGAHGLAVIDTLLGRLDPGPPWRSRLLAQRALLSFVTGAVDGAAELITAAIEAGTQDEDPVSIGWALIARLQLAGPQEALTVVAEGLALPLHDDPESVDLRLLFLANQLIVLANVDATVEYEAVLPRTLAEVERLGTHRLTEVQVTAAQYFFERGEWDQALLYVGQTETVTPYQALARNGIAALIHAHREEWTAAKEYLAAVADTDYSASIDFIIAARAVTFARAMLAEADGDLAGAGAALSVWLDPRLDDNPHARAQRCEVFPLIVRTALAAGDEETARRAAARAATDARLDGDPDQATFSGLCAAMLDGEPAPLLAAADHLADRLRPLATAFAAEEAALLLAARDDEAVARSAFNRAITLYDQLGAAVDLRRVRGRLRPFGIRIGSRGVRRRPTTGWEALTDAELAVVRWVAEGYSNPEIASRLYVSRRTVESHVAHALRKLQVRSRTDIRLALQDRRAKAAS